MTRFRHACQAFRSQLTALPGIVIAVLLLGSCSDRTLDPPPAEGRDYPNLATVPQPPIVPPRAQRESEMKALAEARDSAIQEDAELRAIDPGRRLPPPQARAAAPVTVPAAPADPAPAQAAPATGSEEQAVPRRQAAAPMPRPELPSSLFMGSVAGGDRGAMAEIDRKVLADAVAMARRTNARLRIDGGRSAADRQRVVEEIVRLGLPAQRVSTGPARGAAPAGDRPAIDVFVEY